MYQKLNSLKLKTHLAIHYSACLAGALIMMAGCQISQPLHLHPVVYAGMVLLAAGLIWRILFIKCPHCGSGLFNCRNLSGNCPDCGKELQ